VKHLLLSVCSVSTYKTVRLLPRPWKLPEGTVNHVSLRTLLTGVMMHIMDNPGITCDVLVQKYAIYLHPVALFELVEVTVFNRKLQLNAEDVETSYTVIKLSIIGLWHHSDFVVGASLEFV